MLALILSLILMAGTGLALKGGWRPPRGMHISGFDPKGMGLGALALIAAGYFWGPETGVALILSIMLHEFGHVAAFRLCGHADAQFRLIPLMGGVAISRSLPTSQEKDFFISLMGPGICIAPMVLALVLSDLTYDTAPTLSDWLWTFSGVTAALNFFNLLPLWPLDGSKCLRIVFGTFFPGHTRLLTMIMSGAMLALGMYMQSMLLIIFTLFSAQSLMQAETLLKVQRRMSKTRALWCLAAYVFTTAAHLMGGHVLVAAYL